MKMQISMKLTINKETVSNLNQGQMNVVKGGTNISIPLSVIPGVVCATWGDTTVPTKLISHNPCPTLIN